MGALSTTRHKCKLVIGFGAIQMDGLTQHHKMHGRDRKYTSIHTVARYDKQSQCMQTHCDAKKTSFPRIEVPR
jgi:hypothetical protein